jgi:hypothetical protein
MPKECRWEVLVHSFFGWYPGMVPAATRADGWQVFQETLRPATRHYFCKQPISDNLCEFMNFKVHGHTIHQGFSTRFLKVRCSFSGFQDLAMW